MALRKLNKPKRVRGDGYHHGDLRAALIQAALKCLETRSPTELSLRELAKRAGVSQAAPYRHFASKEDLLAAISQQAFELKIRYMREGMEKARGDATETYYACGLAYFKMGHSHPQHFNLMFSGQCEPTPKHPGLLEAATTTFTLVRDMVKICQKAGIIGPGDPYVRAMSCWTVVHGFTALYANGNLEWLGVTTANAEAALRTLLGQLLLGSQASLAKLRPELKLFQTPESAAYHRLMEGVFDEPG